MSNVIDWQRRFFAAPRIWWTELRVDGGWERTGNFYDSEPGAAIEDAWHKKSGGKSRIQSAPMHTEGLSRERWEPSAAPAPGKGTR